jgi:aminoglycoside/choline kinase family phosphotransferase
MKVNKVLASRSPWTLAHQDFRVENLLFGTADDQRPVMVLDWQGIGRGPGVYDLAYVLGGSMTETLRQRHESELVRTYHETLLSLDINDYSIEQCSADYALAHLMGGLATPILLGGAMDLNNERGVKLVATMASRHAQAALDHDGLRRMREIAG